MHLSALTPPLRAAGPQAAESKATEPVAPEAEAPPAEAEPHPENDDTVELQAETKGGCPACGGYKGLCSHCAGKAVYAGNKCPWGIIKTVGGRKVCYCKTCKGSGTFPLSAVPAPAMLMVVQELAKNP